jgi:hypothetical protein
VYRQPQCVVPSFNRPAGVGIFSRHASRAAADSRRLRGKTMNNVSLRILLATVLPLMCVLVSSGYTGGNGSAVVRVPFEAHMEKAVLEQEFKLKYGQELTVEGQSLKVKFASLLQDSRCPTDVKCVWEGDAKILLRVRRGNAKKANMELHTNQNFAQARKYQHYVIRLVALAPYPKTRLTQKQSDYVATLIIKKE